MNALALAPRFIGRPNAIHVIQGQQAISDDPDVVICTLLGSCVAACLRDADAGIGGLNHFLLPEGRPGSENLSYGAYAMELLINELLKRGARKNRLEAKLFGGARLIRSRAEVGSQNARFAVNFLANEGIASTGGSLGGVYARRIEFWPVSGRVRQQVIENDDAVFGAESKPSPAVKSVASDVELF